MLAEKKYLYFLNERKKDFYAEMWYFCEIVTKKVYKKHNLKCLFYYLLFCYFRKMFLGIFPGIF